jgi:CRISPR system Cascade subunit CasD
MDTLLLQAIGPLQSWGVQSHFTMRDSGLEPSKSGIIGMICCALGRDRCSPIEDLTKLKLGVRVDREGLLSRDFHIVQDVMVPKGKGKKDSIITNRYYLAGAAFLVGLSGELELLAHINAALQKPKWPIFLGRKAYSPSVPVWLPDGVKENQDLETALSSYGWIVPAYSEKMPETLRVVQDDPLGEQIRNDVPISFAERKFTSRRVNTKFIPAPKSFAAEVEA